MQAEDPEACDCPVCTGEQEALQPEDLTILLLACAIRGDMGSVVSLAQELHNQYGTRSQGEVLTAAHNLALIQSLQRSAVWREQAEA